MVTITVENGIPKFDGFRVDEIYKAADHAVGVYKNAGADQTAQSYQIIAAVLRYLYDWQPIESNPKDNGKLFEAYAKVDGVDFVTLAWWDKDKDRFFMLDTCSRSVGFRAVQPTQWRPMRPSPRS